MSTLRVSNIEAKADVSSPSVNEKVKVTNSNGELLIHIDGATSGITTVGISTSGESFRFDSNQNVTFFGSVTGTGLDVNGNADISGNLNVGGVLTYEDVTNIDSVGVVTARNGLHVTGGDLALGTNNPAGGATAGYDRVFNIQAGSSSALSSISFGDSNATGRIESVNGNNGRIAVNASEYITFGTGGTSAERLRITSAGKIGVNENAPAADLVVKQSGNTFTTQSQTVALFQRSSTAGHGAKIAIVAGTGGSSDINFGDTADEDIGSIQYYHTDNSFRFTTNTSERLRIDSSGNLLLKTGEIDIQGGNKTVKTSAGFLQVGTAGSHYLSLITAGLQRLNITSGGNVGINQTSPETHLHVEQDNAHSSTYYLNTDAGILVDNKNASGKSVLKLEGEAALVYGGGGDKFFVADRQHERLRINENGNTIFQGAASPQNGNTGNAAILVRGKTVSGSSTTVDLNISGSYSTNGIGLEIQEYSNTANALATLVFNHGSLKSMIACSRVATNNWGTDLRFYTHPTSTNSANQHKVYERLRISENGNVGINESSPSSLLDVNRGTSDGVLSIFKNDEVSIQFGVWGTGATYARECTINSTRQDGGSYPWLRLAGQDGIRFASDLNNVRGNLNAYGEFRFGVGNDNLISTDQVHSIGNVGVWNTTNVARLQMQERTGIWISFKNGSGTHYGSISQNSPGVLYGSNSDYRLKDNVQNFTGGIELVKRLRPVTFNWNALSGQEDTTTTQRGFLAHEVQEIEPGAVDGVKDEMDRVGDCTNAEGVITQKNVYERQAKDGETWTLVSEEIKDQQLDPAKLVPILTAALKEEIARREALEDQYNALADRITALEP